MPKTYTTAAEDAAEIRRQFKALGWNRNHVSVRARSFSMGSAVDVRIKSPIVNATEANRIAKSVAENVRRCEITGETLSGGNRYVSVDYSRECREILARRHIQALETAVEEMKAERDQDLDTRSLIKIGDTGAYVGTRDGWRYQIWMEGGVVAEFSECSTQHGAFLLAGLLDAMKQAEGGAA